MIKRMGFWKFNYHLGKLIAKVGLFAWIVHYVATRHLTKP